MTVDFFLLVFFCFEAFIKHFLHSKTKEVLSERFCLVQMTREDRSFSLMAFLMVCAWISFFARIQPSIPSVYLLGLCRPVVFLLKSPMCMKILWVVLKGVYDALGAFTLIGSMLAIAAANGMLFFKGQGVYLENFLDAFINMFMYMCKRDNFTDMMYAGLTISKLYFPWFAILALVGAYFLMSLLIYVFLNTYSNEEETLRSTNENKRSSVLAAFVALKVWLLLSSCCNIFAHIFSLMFQP